MNTEPYNMIAKELQQKELWQAGRQAGRQMDGCNIYAHVCLCVCVCVESTAIVTVMMAGSRPSPSRYPPNKLPSRYPALRITRKKSTRQIVVVVAESLVGLVGVVSWLWGGGGGGDGC